MSFRVVCTWRISHNQTHLQPFPSNGNTIAKHKRCRNLNKRERKIVYKKKDFLWHSCNLDIKQAVGGGGGGGGGDIRK